MFCQRCDYQLSGLAAEACPECGRPFNARDARTFLTKRPIAGRRLRTVAAWVAAVWPIPGVLIPMVGMYIDIEYFERHRQLPLFLATQVLVIGCPVSLFASIVLLAPRLIGQARHKNVKASTRWLVFAACVSTLVWTIQFLFPGSLSPWLYWLD